MALTEFEGSSLGAQKAFYVPVGAASPLWFMFAGAATAGMAYWWMTRWTDRTHLEAMFGGVKLPAVAAPPAPEPVLQPEPVAEAFVPVVTAVEDVAEVIAEPVAAVEEAIKVVEAEPAVDAPAEAPKTKAKTRPAAEPPTA